MDKLGEGSPGCPVQPTLPPQPLHRFLGAALRGKAVIVKVRVSGLPSQSPQFSPFLPFEFSLSCFPFLSSAHTLNIPVSSPGIVWLPRDTQPTKYFDVVSELWLTTSAPFQPTANYALRSRFSTKGLNCEPRYTQKEGNTHMSGARSVGSWQITFLSGPACPAPGLLPLLFRPWQPDSEHWCLWSVFLPVCDIG